MPTASEHEQYTLDRQISNRGQAWQMTTVARMWGKMVQVRIKRDSYDQQSYAVVEAWTDTHGWVPLHALLDPAILKVSRNGDVITEAKVDENRLLEMAFQVLQPR
jgi:hypothetical protein